VRRIESIGELLGEHFRFGGRTVVDVGCGTAIWCAGSSGRGASVTGVDTPAMVALARGAPRAGDERYVSGAGEALPLPEARCDLVVWAASLHHVPPPGCATR